MAAYFSLLSQMFDAPKRHLRRAKRLQENERFQAAYVAYRRAAERGNVEAMLALAGLHERGLGTPVSLPQALDWYQAAAKQGSRDGHFGAGSCLMRMERLPRGMRHWFDSISDREPERAGELGALFGARIDLDDAYKMAREHLVEACRAGHAEAHYRLAELLVRGLGGEEDSEQAHDLYIIAAAAGIAGAEYGLGELYRLGKGCAASEETAQLWYKRAAGRGHIPAQLMMAQHLIARGGGEDLAEARRWLQQGSAQGAPHADYLLALIALSASTERDVEKGKHYLQRAAAKGHLHAMKRLAQIYDEGRLGEARDGFEAAGWYKKAAEAGDVEAQFVIGRMYARGDGVPQILTSAARWFARSAEGGHPLGQYNYAIFLERGDGVAADAEASRALLRSAAEQGLGAAQFKLGRDLLNEGDAEGAIWLEQAAAKDHVGALALLGTLYGRGEQVEQDIPKALDMLQRAADLGHVASHIHLADLLRAKGGPIDPVLAALTQAAESGSADADLILSRMYAAGDGVERNQQIANARLEQAAKRGHPQALFDLGVSHCRGEARPRDLALGTHYYRQAGEAGHIIGKYNYAMMVLGERLQDADVALAKRFLQEAALAGLGEAQEACHTYQLAGESLDANVEAGIIS